MQQYRKNLGKVSLTAEGPWDGSKPFDILSIVYDENTQHGFISKKEVPAGVDLYNKEYWMPFNVSGYVDNNIIILSNKTSDTHIKSYTIEEAINSIAPVGRRPGAILGFYNENSDRLDIGGRWEIWQFNSTTISEWEDVKSWTNIYYNYNKFVGWYKSEDYLKKHFPFPEVGCYAFVGSELNEASVYRCDNKYVWVNTTQHAWDYIKVIVQGNVTVGENGNWFNNGVDTGIPASVKGENGKTPIIRNNDNVLEVSYDNLNWEPISDEIAVWLRVNNNKLEMTKNKSGGWEVVSDYIAAWFRWQSNGGEQIASVGKIQITRDGVSWTDLSSNFVNHLRISKYIGADESLPTSGIAEGTIYAKGPYYDENDTLNDNPIYRLWVYAWKGNTLAWQDNGEFTSIAAGIVQETGDSETEVMSQKAVTDELSKLSSEMLFDKVDKKGIEIISDTYGLIDKSIESIESIYFAPTDDYLDNDFILYVLGVYNQDTNEIFRLDIRAAYNNGSWVITNTYQNTDAVNSHSWSFYNESSYGILCGTVNIDKLKSYGSNPFFGYNANKAVKITPISKSDIRILQFKYQYDIQSNAESIRKITDSSQYEKGVIPYSNTSVEKNVLDAIKDIKFAYKNEDTDKVHIPIFGVNTSVDSSFHLAIASESNPTIKIIEIVEENYDTIEGIKSYFVENNICSFYIQIDYSSYKSLKPLVWNYNTPVGTIIPYSSNDYIFDVLRKGNSESLLGNVKRIVHIGTSIPAAGGSTAYPMLYGNRLGINVINESIGSSIMRIGKQTHGSNPLEDEFGLNGCNWSNILRSLSMTQKEKLYIMERWTTERRRAKLIEEGYTQSQVASVVGYANLLTGTFEEESSDATIVGWPSSKPIDIMLDEYSEVRKLALSYSWDSNGGVEVEGILQKHFSNPPDLWVIDHMRNDAILDNSYEELMTIPNDIEDRHYSIGAMVYLIKKIWSNIPTAKIVILSHYSNEESGRLPDRVMEAQRKVSNILGVPFINLSDKLNITNKTITTAGYWDNSNKWNNSGYDGVTNNATWITSQADENPRKLTEPLGNLNVGTWVHDIPMRMVYLQDATHPNSLQTREVIADSIANGLLGLFR